jgi:signal transduction histidine kinase
LGGRVIELGHSLLSEDLSTDRRFPNTEPTIDGQQVCFYFGQPLMIDSTIPIGTLTVLDFKPRRISAHQRAVLTSIARQVELQLEFIVRQKATIESSGLAAKIAIDHQVSTRRQALTNFLLHDVINAATAVKADAEYVRGRTRGDGEVDEALDDIAEAVDTMADLLHSAREILLDPEAALTSFARDIDLTDVIEEIVELHEYQFTKAKRRVYIVGHLRDPFVAGDRKLLREMIESLVGATLAATPPGTDAEIHLQELDSGTIELLYCDQGDVTADTLQARVGGSAFAGNANRDSEVEVARDSIQALSLCRMIVEAHGGTMSVDRLNHTGRRFRIHLPR